MVDQDYIKRRREGYIEFAVKYSKKDPKGYKEWLEVMRKNEYRQKQLNELGLSVNKLEQACAEHLEKKETKEQTFVCRQYDHYCQCCGCGYNEGYDSYYCSQGCYDTIQDD